MKSKNSRKIKDNTKTFLLMYGLVGVVRSLATVVLQNSKYVKYVCPSQRVNGSKNIISLRKRTLAISTGLPHTNFIFFFYFLNSLFKDA